ncbi:LURP-one-related family protein [Anaerofilum sp. BX8]|uniref:LURP-one-related family protein n=1 Tax=Anaerofilum hominis TaxID=2763016 RepID=A0A923REF5_9FIRM|nr:LURP-one-related family protein [Anaerofilum hominis]MBC5582257.1 LURP-one-related family protein [Anaerofilum hominis]
MRLLFKQRFFSWLDSYDIYDESGNVVYTVEGKLSFGHCLDILDASGQYVGTVKEEILTFLPRFRIYAGGQCLGEIRKEFTFFKPAFQLDCNGWRVEGDIFSWEYQITDAAGEAVAHLSKELLHLTDTYVLEFPDPQNALLVLMIALAIDAAKCSAGD